MKPAPLKLLPCPFCGAQADEPFYWESKTKEHYEISCSACPASAGSYHEDSDSAIATWNRRHIDRELVERVLKWARIIVDEPPCPISRPMTTDEIIAELEKENGSK